MTFRRIVDPIDAHGDLLEILFTSEQIDARLDELAGQIDADYAGEEVVLLAVLKGAVMVMADLSRKLHTPTRFDFMSVASYGSSTSSSGIVRILKDHDEDISGRHVLIVEDVLDSGLTFDWLRRTLGSRGAASLRVMALLRKPEAIDNGIEVDYLGFDIPNEFVVGYGLDYDQRYRNLQCIATLHPRVVQGG